MSDICCECNLIKIIHIIAEHVSNEKLRANCDQII